MNVRRVLISFLLVGLAVAPQRTALARQVSPQLIVTPDSGRGTHLVYPDGHLTSDVFYLAGGGYPANKTIDIPIACPDWARSYNGRFTYHVKTDRHGNFSGVKEYVFSPLVKPTPCTLYASRGDNPFEVSAPFTILANNQAPPQTFDITLRDRHATSGGKVLERVDVRAAPAAKLQFTERIPGLATARFHATLPWTGHAVIMRTIPYRSVPSGLVVISVRGRLGDLTGTTTMRYMLRR